MSNEQTKPQNLTKIKWTVLQKIQLLTPLSSLQAKITNTSELAFAGFPSIGPS